MRTVRRKFITSTRYQNRYELIFIITGMTGSALMPLTSIVIYHYYGMKATTIFSCAKVFIMTLILLVSYYIIIHSVERSSRVWASSSHNNKLLCKNKRTLKKVKRTVHLVIGGYLLTLIPFICSFGVESYLYYKNDSPGANDSLLYTFRAVAETVLYWIFYSILSYIFIRKLIL